MPTGDVRLTCVADRVMLDSPVLQTGAHHQRDEDANTSVFPQDCAHAHAPLGTGFVRTGLAYQVGWTLMSS